LEVDPLGLGAQSTHARLLPPVASGLTVADWLDHWKLKAQAQATLLRRVDAERFYEAYVDILATCPPFEWERA
jgi:hypothetical protein